MRRAFILAAGALVAGCSTTGTIYRDRVVEVNVPVAQPCAAERPSPVVPLKDKTPEWDSLDVRQKAALVAKQTLERQTYGEQLHAATAACAEIAQ